ncbi:MAG: ScyD/ScyE family protein [Anaerolineae bacterium]|nr:ScyD/ScyE family protein [Anaerolineae bacterium]
MRTLKLIVALLIVLSLSGLAAAQPPLPEIPGATLVASGFNGPQGVLVDPEGNVWVIDSGMGGEQVVQVPGETGELEDASLGMSARIAMIAPDGTQTDVAMLPSIALPIGDVAGGARLALLNGTLYATSGWWGSDGTYDPPDGFFAGVVRVDSGEVTLVADSWAFEESNNPDGTILDNHPYGLAVGPDGWLWVTDAGANDLYRVNPDTGEIVLVAVFDALPGVFPNPARGGAMEADPVPTGVAFDADGNAYVSLLSGAPFVPGSAKVLRVSADGAVSDYTVGLTTLTDLVRGPDGELYAVQFGLFSEEGPMPNSGAVLRIHEGSASEVVVSDLPFPTGISFDSDGNAYIAINGVGAPGSGAVVRFDLLTEIAGEPLPSPR